MAGTGEQEGDGEAARMRAPGLLGDLSGAFADLGTFLPLMLGVLALGNLQAPGALIGFGLFALATAAIYRRPVPVQPMKAVAAIAISAGLSADAIVACGLIVGVVLTVLAVSGGIERLARFVPQSVLAGIQFGIGLQLVWFGVGLAAAVPAVAIACAGLLLVVQFTPAKPLAALIVLAAGVGWSVQSGGADLSGLAVGLHLPSFHWPPLAGFLTAAGDVAPAQLALTLTNAVLATAALAARLFPRDTDRISPRRLALSTGLLNLLLAPFGAFPMCHGAGGLAAQHRFGARTWRAPALFGAVLLALGLFYGNGAVALLAMVPAAVLGALMVVAGGDLAMSKRLFDGRPSCLAVILVTGAVCLFANVAIGLVAGLAAEVVRTLVVRHFLGRRASADR